MNCKNCNAEVKQKYCPNCGEPAEIKRIDRNYIVYEIGRILNFERGILYTIRELLLRPGQNIRSFILEKRNRLVKPIVFIIVTSLIYSLINHFFHIEDEYIKFQEEKPSTTGLLFKWVQDNYGYANIIMAIFIAFWTKLFFKKNKYNFFEILILLCFVMGIGMLIYSVFALIQALTHIDLMKVAGIVGFIYSVLAIGQFFGKSKFLNYVKASFSYFLGFLTFSLATVLLGTLIDFIF